MDYGIHSPHVRCTTRFNRSNRILVILLLLLIFILTIRLCACECECEWPDRCTFFLFSQLQSPCDVAIHIRLARAVKPTKYYWIFLPKPFFGPVRNEHFIVTIVVDVPFLASMYLWMHSFGSSSFIPFVYWITNIENEIAKPKRKIRIRKRKL